MAISCNMTSHRLTPLERQNLVYSLLQQKFNPQQLTIVDESAAHVGHEGAKSGASHFAVTIVAAQFSGVSLLKRHQLVLNELKDLIPQELHAVRVNARSPEEIPHKPSN